MASDQDLVNELFYYTLGHGDPAFIHQHAVDAIAAQTATADDKPIKLLFALIGLYLHVERGFTGKQVQLAHMKLGKYRQAWPVLPLPEDRGTVTIADVLAAEPGPQRDEVIHQWCVSVWEPFASNRPTIVELLEERGIV